MLTPTTSGIRVRESDGSPDVRAVRDIALTGITVTDNGSGSVTLTVTPGVPGGTTGQVQFNSAGAFDGADGVVYAASGTHLTVTAQAVGDTNIATRAITSQTANQYEGRNVDGVAVTVIRADGTLAIPSRVPTATVQPLVIRSYVSEVYTEPIYTIGVLGAESNGLLFRSNGRVQFDNGIEFPSGLSIATGGSFSLQRGNSQKLEIGDPITFSAGYFFDGVDRTSFPIAYALRSSTTNSRLMSSVYHEWADNTDATRKGRVIHSVYDTAARECVRYEADGSRGYVIQQVHTTAPADSLLTNGSVAFYVDGSGNLAIKLKDSGGTVRTGAVTLT